MEPMTKERLMRYIPLKFQTENYMERIARMKSSEHFPPSWQNDDSKHSQGSSTGYMANAVLRRMETEALLADKIASNLAEMDKIEAAINSLDDPLEAEVLWLRYIDVDENGQRLKWEDIAEAIYHNVEKVRTTARLHNNALASLMKLSTKNML